MTITAAGKFIPQEHVIQKHTNNTLPSVIHLLSTYASNLWPHTSIQEICTYHMQRDCQKQNVQLNLQVHETSKGVMHIFEIT